MRPIYNSSYTGEQLDAAIAAILGLDLSKYLTSSEIESKFGNYSTTSEMRSIITEEIGKIDLSGYVTDSTIDSKFEEYSTTSEMKSAITAEINKIDLSVYAKTSEMHSAITEELAGLDLSDAIDARLVEYVKNDVLNSTLQSYYTKSETNSAITTEIGKIDLSVYAKTSALAEYATNDSVTDALKSYSTTSEMQTAITTEIGKIDLSVYAKTEALADYAEKEDVYTKTEVDNKISLDALGINLSVYATTDYVIQNYVGFGQLSRELLGRPTNESMETYVEGKLALTIETATDGSKYSQLSADVNKIIFNSGEIEINSDNFTLTPDGNVSMTGVINSLSGGTIGALCLTDDGLSLDPVYAGDTLEVSLCWDNLPGLITRDDNMSAQYRANGMTIVRPNVVDGNWLVLSDGTNRYTLYLAADGIVKYKAT